jgi:hypothetical protein
MTEFDQTCSVQDLNCSKLYVFYPSILEYLLGLMLAVEVVEGIR